MYDPQIGSFYQEDPIGFAAGDFNIYRYVGNQPTNLTDPSGFTPVGHHWIPVSVLTDPLIRPFLSQEAFEVAMGASSAQTSPNHLFARYGGVAHGDYTTTVRRQMLEIIVRLDPGTVIEVGPMETIISNVENGRHARTGAVNPQLRAFNDAIRQQRTTFVAANPNAQPAPATRAARRTAGQDFIRTSGRVLSLMMIPAGIVIADGTGLLAAAAEERQPPHFRLAIQAMVDGNLGAAERHLFGGPTENRLGGFVGQMNAAGHGRAAMRFQAQWDEMVTELRAQAEAAARPAAPVAPARPRQ